MRRKTSSTLLVAAKQANWLTFRTAWPLSPLSQTMIEKYEHCETAFRGAFWAIGRLS